MRYASTSALVAIVLLLDAAAFAQSLSVVDQGEQTAIDNARALDGIDANIDDDPKGPLCATSAKPMSLLGVQYQGGPSVRGTVMALADNDPLRVALTKKEQALKALDRKQAEDVAKFGGNSWGWDATVTSLEDSVDWFSKQVAGREEGIAKLKKSRDKSQEANPAGSLASFDKAIADDEKALAKARASLGDAMTRLPLAQANLARYAAATSRARLAKASAEKAVLVAAAACP